jgi:broad specificity phosphatase PhoE
MSPSKPRRRASLTACAAGLALAAGLWLPAALAAGGEATVVYLVRHAEKAPVGEDPELAPQGVDRAAALAELLRDAGITAVHITDFRRTRGTAAPAAVQLGLAIRDYHWDDMDALVAAIRNEGGRHLVVGHSDTTPELVGLLGGDPGAPIDEPTEYDRLYVVTLGPDGTVTTVLLRYGL